MRINNVEYGDALELRETLNLPLKMAEVLSFQEKTIQSKLVVKRSQFLSPCPCGSSKSKKKFPLPEQFMEAFKSMAIKEQIGLYSRTVNYLNSISKGTTELEVSIQQTQFQNVKIKSGFRWVEHSIRLDLNQGIMFIFGPKSEILNLSEYLLRISTDTSINCFVLTSTKANYSKTIRFWIQDRVHFEQCHESIHKLIEKLLFIKLRNEYNELTKQSYSSLLLKDSRLNRYASQDRLYTTKETPKEVFRCDSQKVVNNILIPEITLQQFKKEYSLQDVYFDPKEFLPTGYNYDKLVNNNFYNSCGEPTSFIKQFVENDGVFKIEKVFHLGLNKVLQLFSGVSEYSKWNPNIVSSKIVSVFPGASSMIVAETRQSATKEKQIRSFTYIRSLFSKNDNMYIVDRSIISKDNQGKRGIDGHIIISFWKIVPMKNYTLVQGLVKLNYNLEKKTNEIQTARQYIEGYLNFDQYERKETPKLSMEIFDISLDHQSYVDFISQLLHADGEKENVKRQSLQKGRKESFDDESFYTAQGVSDWNSRFINPTKRGFGSLSSIRSLKKIPTKQVIMEPIQEQTSIIKQTSSLLGQAKDLLTRAKSIPRKKESWKANSSCITIKSSENSYATHICKTSGANLNSKGMAIIPQDYISKRSPTGPKKQYPYQKIKGKDWDHYLCKSDWTILQNGEFKFTNLEKLKFQNGVLTKVLKKMATNLIAGKGFNVSLPVEVFSELSIFELTARGMCFAPLFLEKAAKVSDKLERMKHYISFSLGFSLSYLQMAKPFNPILGQTYQAWINGCPFYCQQTSHHPPITSYLFVGRGYKVYGNLTPQMNLSMNSGVGYNSGQCVVVFDDDPDHKIYSRSPGGQIQGLTYGDRKFNLSGKGFYYDNQGYYAEITYNCFKKSLFSFSKQTEPTDSLQGQIYKVTPRQIQKFRSKFDRDGMSKKDLKEQVCSISGRYTQALNFNNKLYFDVKQDEPCMLQQQRYPLASNCNYRQDIIHKRNNDNDRAQVEKDRLENVQRNDKKLRSH